MEHLLYVDVDFTDEELERRNKLAISVVEGGLSVCKRCGEYEAGLDNPCMTHVQRVTLSAIYNQSTAPLHNHSIVYLLENEMIDSVPIGNGFRITEKGLKSVDHE